MQSDNEITSKTKKPWWRRINFEFYYFEHVGNRYYLRFTPFGLISIIVSVLLLFVYILVVAWYESNNQINDNFITPVSSPYKQSETAASPGPSPSVR